MAFSTPFLSAFGPLLFGRRRRSRLQQLLLSTPEQCSLSQYQEAFGEFVSKTQLVPTVEGKNSRERIYTPLVTFWAFLAQVLERGTSCRHAVRRIIAWSLMQMPDRRPPSTATVSYCDARARLEDSVLQQIGDDLSDRLERNIPTDQLWKGLHVKIVDGTTASMPDTAANQAEWPQPRSQKPGCGFPLLKLVGLFSLASGALLQIAHGSLRQHELSLARQFWPSLDPGDLLLADRGFCSYQDLSALAARGVDAVMRLHQARPGDFRRGTRLGSNDRIVLWSKPAQRPKKCSVEEYAAMPATLTVRMLRFQVPVNGFRTTEVVLVTTLLDAECYPAAALAELYFQRWTVELHFREIKTLLGLDILRCLSPQMIVKEMAMHRIAYNLVRALMQRAAVTHHVELPRLSFKGTLDSLQHVANTIQACAGKPRCQAHLVRELLATIAQDLLPLRPGRSEPRAKKRRAKNYHLLTKPRHDMKIPSHRNRPKPL
jgi:DDE family transposase